MVAMQSWHRLPKAQALSFGPQAAAAATDFGACLTLHFRHAVPAGVTDLHFCHAVPALASQI
jgi:hypothetical protein